MKNPKLIVNPFAKNGQKNVIPENYETSMESNQATWDQGFGQITMLPVAAGGLPPKGQDFNGIFNQISENIVYLSQGGRFKFSAEYAEAIGGYPKGAILQSDDEKKEYLSLIDNNKVDFNTAVDISASWKLVNTDDLLAQIASKQPKGDYATKTELNSGLAGKQPVGDYATKTEVSSKLAKDQNGADIPNKPKFIENLGLSELFSPLSIFYTEGGYAVIKTGEVYDHFAVKGGMFGSYNPQVDQWNFQMPVTGPEQTVGAYKNRVMSQFAVSEALKKKLNTDDVVHGTGNSESKVISQKATTVAIDEIYSKMFGVGMTFRDVTAERTVGTNYVNSSLKPRVVYFVGMPAQATTNSLTTTGKINDKTVVQFVDASATAGDIRSFILVVPPGASYSCHSASHTVSGFNYWFEWE